LAQIGTHTKGREVGTNNVIVQGETWDISLDLLADMSGKLEAATDAPPVDSAAYAIFKTFWQQLLYNFLERLLSSSFPNPAVVPHVNRFLRKVLAAFAHQIRIGHMNYPMIQMLNRLFGYDMRICAWYYTHYGVGGKDEGFIYTHTDTNIYIYIYI
jgi:hypothetical protein